MPPEVIEQLVGIDARPARAQEVQQRAAQRRVALGGAVVERGRAVVRELAQQAGEHRARDRLPGRAAHRHPHDVVGLALEQARAGVDHGAGDPVDPGRRRGWSG